jgi:hypothetical protein
MANINRGEVDLKAGDKIWTLVFSVNALCELEELAGKSALAFANELSDEENVSIKKLRLLFWIGLRDRHPDVDEKAAGSIMSGAGLNEAMQAATKALRAAFPQGEAPAEAQDTARAE